ncbi:CpaF/VirB11 family protein, partial [Candidatus Marsarchaeota archaeon]|nr:CpaF/VirB11 family protein [Candidatus Marsarchaeota archaeon]
IMVIGEIRTKKDAETLFEAIHTGHSVYGTVHADNVQDTIIRISNPPIDIPKILINAIGGIVSVFRHRKLGIRRVLEIGEILKSGDASVLYRWNIRDDSFYQINEMSRLLETLGVYSGLTRKEISDDIAQKSKILNWMSDNNIVDVNDSGFIVSQYYLNKSKIFDIINQNLKYSKDLFE